MSAPAWKPIPGAALTVGAPVPPPTAIASFAFAAADVARFLDFVEVLPSGCWFWSGARSRGKGNRKWYGSFWVGGRVLRAHRFACEAIGAKGALPAGWHRDHDCCFSLCVNPAHVEYVTHAENQRRKLLRRSLRPPLLEIAA